MFFIISRKTFLTGFVLITAVVTMFSLMTGHKMSATSGVSELKTVIIDAGHGSPDGGARGISGVMEKDLNLAVAKKLKVRFEEGGYKVIMTREEDRGLHDEGVQNKKRSDLNKRVNMMKNTNADLFISIHMNQFSESKYKGAQVFYSKNDEESMKLGKSVQTELRQALDNTNNREAKQAYDSIFVMKNATIPAILVECGFLSNPEEEKRLQDESYQDAIALAVYNGVTKSNSQPS